MDAIFLVIFVCSACVLYLLFCQLKSRWYRHFKSRDFVVPEQKQYKHRKKWCKPETNGLTHLLMREDAKFGRTEFFVYILATDKGHYIGHSGNLRGRIHAHLQNNVISTAGYRPRLIWKSRKFACRADACKFEATLKRWRDSKSKKYREITGLVPVTWRYKDFK